MLTTLIFYSGYGLTEVSPVSHILPHDQTLSKAGSIGVLLPNLEARLVGEDGDVKPGERGELWLHGPTIMKVSLQYTIRSQMSLILWILRVTWIIQQQQKSQSLLKAGSKLETFVPVMLKGSISLSTGLKT